MVSHHLICCCYNTDDNVRKGVDVARALFYRVLCKVGPFKRANVSFVVFIIDTEGEKSEYPTPVEVEVGRSNTVMWYSTESFQMTQVFLILEIWPTLESQSPFTKSKSVKIVDKPLLPQQRI